MQRYLFCNIKEVSSDLQKIFLSEATQRCLRTYSIYPITAAFGGLIGLTVGISVISICEFFYWFTMRLYIDRKKLRKQKLKQMRHEITSSDSDSDTPVRAIENEGFVGDDEI